MGNVAVVIIAISLFYACSEKSDLEVEPQLPPALTIAVDAKPWQTVGVSLTRSADTMMEDLRERGFGLYAQASDNTTETLWTKWEQEKDGWAYGFQDTETPGQWAAGSPFYIFWPQEPSFTVDYYAYYPFNAQYISQEGDGILKFGPFEQPHEVGVDLLYAQHQGVTRGSTVKLDFQHALARVGIASFSNQLGHGITLKSIGLQGKFFKGLTIDIAKDEWKGIDPAELKETIKYGTDAKGLYVAGGTTADFRTTSQPRMIIPIDNVELTGIFTFDEAVDLGTSWAGFAFDKGTEGQKATRLPDGFDADGSSVEKGAHLSYYKKRTTDEYQQTSFQATEKYETPTADDAVTFWLTLNDGYMFTPTQVSFVATRYGTNDGFIKASWMTADKETPEIVHKFKPNRDNSTVPYTIVKQTISNGPTAQGGQRCGLRIYLYDIYSGKDLGLSDITITGQIQHILTNQTTTFKTSQTFERGKYYELHLTLGNNHEVVIK